MFMDFVLDNVSDMCDDCPKARVIRVNMVMLLMGCYAPFYGGFVMLSQHVDYTF